MFSIIAPPGTTSQAAFLKYRGANEYFSSIAHLQKCRWLHFLAETAAAAAPPSKLQFFILVFVWWTEYEKLKERKKEEEKKENI